MENKVDLTPLIAASGTSSSQSSDARFDELTKGLFRREGGYVNDKDDRGGATNYGITEGILRKYEKDHGNLGPDNKPLDVTKLTKDQARSIYKEYYYDKNHIAEIGDGQVAEHVLDLVVNHNLRSAAKMVQEAINRVTGGGLHIDGVMGRKTLDAINKATPDQLRAINDAIVDIRSAYYRSLAERDPSQTKFLRGWLRRAESLRRK